MAAHDDNTNPKVRALNQFRTERQDASAEAPERGKPETIPASYDPDDPTKVPGVVWMLIEWIVKSALYPNRSLAVGTALLIVTMLMGRRVEGPTKGGTQLYVIGIAPTATGKQHQMDCAKSALRAAGAEGLIGPDDIRSSVGLVSVIEKREIFLSLIDEFGNMLERSTGSDSNSWGAIHSPFCESSGDCTGPVTTLLWRRGRIQSQSGGRSSASLATARLQRFSARCWGAKPRMGCSTGCCLSRGTPDRWRSMIGWA